MPITSKTDQYDMQKEHQAGDLPDEIYWKTKFAALKLDAALAAGHSDGAVQDIVSALIDGCSDVLKDHPKHDQVRQWLKKALLLRARLNPYAVPESLASGCAHWSDRSFEAAWISYHRAATILPVACGGSAREIVSEARDNLALAAACMWEWPREVQAWVEKARKEMSDFREAQEAERSAPVT